MSFGISKLYAAILLVAIIAVIAAYFFVSSGMKEEFATTFNPSIQGERAIKIEGGTYSHGVFLQNTGEKCFNGNIKFSYVFDEKEHSSIVYDIVVRKGEMTYVELPSLTNNEGGIKPKIVSVQNNAPLSGECY